MGFDVIDLFLSAIVILVYGSICIISIIFTFSLDLYSRIYERLNFNIISTPILTPVEQSIDWFDNWAMKNNVIIGPILIIFSLIDIQLFFSLINTI